MDVEKETKNRVGVTGTMQVRWRQMIRCSDWSNLPVDSHTSESIQLFKSLNVVLIIFVLFVPCFARIAVLL